MKVCSPEKDCSAPTLGTDKVFMDVKQQANAYGLSTTTGDDDDKENHNNSNNYNYNGDGDSSVAVDDVDGGHFFVNDDDVNDIDANSASSDDVDDIDDDDDDDDDDIIGDNNVDDDDIDGEVDDDDIDGEVDDGINDIDSDIDDGEVDSDIDDGEVDDEDQVYENFGVEYHFAKYYQDNEDVAELMELLIKNGGADRVQRVKQHLVFKDALHQYTKDSGKINGALRSSANTGIAPSPDMQQWIDDAACGLVSGLYALGPILGLKLPLHKDEDGLLYRGLTNAPLMRSLYNNYEVGTIIQDAAFFSTTRTKSVVDESFSSATDPDDNILYKITHSFSGRFVNGISYFKGEDEVLFCPGTRFYVYKSEGNTVWMHEMHDDEEVNITVRDAIAERDFDEEDDEVVTEEEIDNDDDDDDDEEVVDDDGDEDVDDDDDDDDDAEVVDDEMRDGEEVVAEKEEVIVTDEEGDNIIVQEVDDDDHHHHNAEASSGSVWRDGCRRSARLLAKNGGSKAEPLLGSTVDHLGRRRSLRLQQKMQ
jgi:hypothetical protein